jgi:hypothetical protein
MAVTVEAKVTCGVPNCPEQDVCTIGVSKYGVGNAELPDGWVWDGSGNGVYCPKHAVPKKDAFGNDVRE